MEWGKGDIFVLLLRSGEEEELICERWVVVG
jgi:hypothetical protein